MAMILNMSSKRSCSRASKKSLLFFFSKMVYRILILRYTTIEVI